ncbi:hypothetical protein TrRE_jg5113 [Triparma retinervis]|uniref:Creatinase n=1 Tax=Triparma retinervis TaxID=2557542 RepID=A0A9W7EFK2_9STRA|nr:hypothetical protein TrRE_jg5113 [Triparma retinervis]
MDRRVAGLRGIMNEKGLDACVLTSYHNVKYFSDFLYCSFGRPYAAVVTHDNVTTVSAMIDGGQPWRRTVGDNVIFTDWNKENYWSAVNELVKQANGGGEAVSLRIGLELDSLPVDRYHKFSSLFSPSSEIVDVGGPTMKFRMVKSDEEVAVIKNAAWVADVGGAACKEAIAVGVPEHEVALESTRAMVREIARLYPDSEIMDTWTWFQSGINTDGAHNPVTTRKVELGDILSLNCFPMVSGYYVALERTLFCGQPSDAHLKIWESNVKVHEAGLKAIQVGRTCGDVAKELNEIFAEEGLLQYRSFGYGHSFGVLSHYYGREAGLELREDIDTVILPGHVISMEPMIAIPEGQPGAGGYREHDILVVGEDGGIENITAFPFGPEHNIVSA